MACLTRSQHVRGNRKFAHNRNSVDRGVVEFDLIDQYFNRPFRSLSEACNRTVVATIGDDCATLAVGPGNRLYVTTDTLVQGVHFFSDHPAFDLGWKALACNLSDLAAAGAQPMGFTLNLTLPRIDDAWLSGFSQGLLAMAQQASCPLVGGDTTSAGAGGVLSISITAMGQAPVSHHGFGRHLARVGDDVWVSGLPGLARIGLLAEYSNRKMLSELGASAAEQAAVVSHLADLPADLLTQAKSALYTPTPQLELSGLLSGHAHACIDLSDGLSGDLAHISKASACQIQIDQAAVEALWTTRFPSLRVNTAASKSSLLGFLKQASLIGGDDYQLCWSASPKSRSVLESLVESPARIGTVVDGQGVWLIQNDNSLQPLYSRSYDHFQVSSRE